MRPDEEVDQVTQKINEVKQKYAEKMKELQQLEAKKNEIVSDMLRLEGQHEALLSLNKDAGEKK